MGFDTHDNGCYQACKSLWCVILTIAGCHAQRASGASLLGVDAGDCRLLWLRAGRSHFRPVFIVPVGNINEISSVDFSREPVCASARTKLEHSIGEFTENVTAPLRRDLPRATSSQ